MRALMEGLRRCGDWQGRTDRRTFLAMYFDILLAMFGLMLLAMVIKWNLKVDITWVLRYVIYALHIPWIMAGWRRMHDVGRSGLWFFVPVVGLLLAIWSGQTITNRYGAPRVVAR